MAETSCSLHRCQHGRLLVAGAWSWLQTAGSPCGWLRSAAVRSLWTGTSRSQLPLFPGAQPPAAAGTCPSSTLHYIYAYQQDQHLSCALQSATPCLNEQSTDHQGLLSSVHYPSWRQERSEGSRPVCTWVPQRAPWMRPETLGSRMCQQELPPALAARPAVHAEPL